ncbi:MAG: histidine kinase dimerization/phosphoacceptor domain -containing protein [Methanobacteriaceae archaeon]|nr:histidine kinase dimerization/phosphoacceptor domain -containing protein [Methanobacteriaceae archaeon]
MALLSEDGTENEVLFLDSGGLECNVDPELPMPIRGLRGKAYETGKAVYDNNFLKSPWMKYMPPGHVDLYNVLFAPLKIDKKAVGLVGLANKEEGFNDHDAVLATLFGELAAIALSNSWNYEKLEMSEERFHELFKNMKSGVAVLKASDSCDKFIFTDFNRAAEEIDQIERENVIGKELIDIFPGADRMGIMETIKRVCETGKPELFPMSFYEDNRISGYRESYIYKLKSGEIVVVYDDLTSQKKAQEQIKKSLEEKEMLLKEIYHRVKNNLMVISSLLRLQSHHITDKEALGIFKESENRAKSMALIHERLYRSTDLKKIDFGDYIRTLTMDLYHTYVPDPDQIQLKVEVENLKLDINTAIPLGLIVNELVSNSMKHAFPGDAKGSILVRFTQDNDMFKLMVSDDGVGMPDGFDFQKSKSLGLHLVNSLSDQIDAELKMENRLGTTFYVIFKEKEMI